MEAFFVSIGIVAFAEIGDKTQLLALILAVRFKKPFPIIFGILFATLITHGLAGAVGIWITTVLSPETLRWVLGLSFILMSIWTLIPDKIENEKVKIAPNWSVFGATVITFFLAEMGDKTQIATIALSAHYTKPLVIIAGTTIGMLLADIPVVFIGSTFSNKISMKLIRWLAASFFIILGLFVLAVPTPLSS